MEWLAPSIVASLVGTALLFFVFCYLYFQDRKNYMAVWTVSWLVYLLRYAVMLFIINGCNSSFLLILNQTASLVSGILLLWGAYLFAKRPFPKIFAYLGAAGFLWIISSIVLKFSFLVMSLPTFTFLAVVYIWTGICFIKSDGLKGPEMAFTGWLFIIWGLHKADYPFLRPVEWFAPYGYLIGATLEFAVALGMLMVYFRKARMDLFDSEKQRHEMISNISDVIVVIGPQGKMQYVSPNMEKWFGWKPDEVVGTYGLERVHPDDKRKIQEEFIKVIAENLKVRPLKCRYLCKDNQYKPIEVIATDMTQDSSIQGVLMNFRDISDREQSEAALKWELRLNTARADISRELMSQEYDIKKVSDIALEYALSLTNSQHGFAASIDKNTRDMEAHTLTDMFKGQCRVENKSITFPIGRDGKYPTLFGVPLNTRKPVFTNRPAEHPGASGVPEGHIPIKNFLGVPVIMGGVLVGLIALANAEDGYTEKDMKAIERLSEIYALALHRHLYEMEKNAMERQLQQIQKLEAIGALAGGIAHDFNNLLFPIVGMSELLLEDLDPESPEHEYAEEIFSAGRRGSDLVKQILAFSRQAEQEKSPIRLQDIVGEALKLSRASIPVNVEIQQDIRKDCGWILADPTQMHQIVMNLVTNAFHAVEDISGTISVSLKETELALDDLWSKALAPGKYVVLSVCDNGVGIEPSIMQKIFEPYFTTKKQGKGTGLGMALVHGIVKDHKGDIRLYSEPGKGTTVNVYLPLIIDASQTPKNSMPDRPLEGTEHILLVDDEASIIHLERQVLQRIGYKVTAFNKSPQALEAFQADPQDFDLVMTDMTMPNMTGEQIIKAMLAIRPDIPVILCTGFSEKINQETARTLGVKGFLMKPIVKSELAQTIRAVLDKAKARQPS
ncbi:PAS domain S-box-containing protein [Desulfatibacillum alkenivorans DSM 16219]|jgi:PAS domain S-box-containing protein|uniref:histidine kinase n=1 Tax=Desulfatibacillum alkenivorans DSM 16219 TaxID=1121393 RepID=A0A1M6YHH9_9BACT|nr:ATP-binding protein [Desulfatibacillum alkenivorans]SHL17580.1 PAS domain S-box-containing protein [Desulfatibacillum alkenivorans DSM 16219]